jgi:hypothetical protein
MDHYLKNYLNIRVCNDQEVYDEAITYAIKAINARIRLWDGVLEKLS